MSTAIPGSRRDRKVRSVQKTDALDQKLVIESLMRDRKGRRWVWLRLKECRVFADDGQLDPQYLAWEKGRRTSGLELLRQVSAHCPREYILMTEENTRIILEVQEADEQPPEAEQGTADNG